MTTEQLQPHGKHIPRRQCIPILYTKGTHYDVGFDVVRFFPLDFHFSKITKFHSDLKKIILILKKFILILRKVRK